MLIVVICAIDIVKSEQNGTATQYLQCDRSTRDVSVVIQRILDGLEQDDQ